MEVVGDLGRNRDQGVAAILLGCLHRNALDAVDGTALEVRRDGKDDLDQMARGQRRIRVALERHKRGQTTTGYGDAGLDFSLRRTAVGTRFALQRPGNASVDRGRRGLAKTLFIEEHLFAGDRRGRCRVGVGGRRCRCAGRGCSRRGSTRRRRRRGRRGVELRHRLPFGVLGKASGRTRTFIHLCAIRHQTLGEFRAGGRTVRGWRRARLTVGLAICLLRRRRRVGRRCCRSRSCVPGGRLRGRGRFSGRDRRVRRGRWHEAFDHLAQRVAVHPGGITSATQQQKADQSECEATVIALARRRHPVWLSRGRHQVFEIVIRLGLSRAQGGSAGAGNCRALAVPDQVIQIAPGILLVILAGRLLCLLIRFCVKLVACEEIVAVVFAPGLRPGLAETWELSDRWHANCIGRDMGFLVEMRVDAITTVKIGLRLVLMDRLDGTGRHQFRNVVPGGCGGVFGMRRLMPGGLFEERRMFRARWLRTGLRWPLDVGDVIVLTGSRVGKIIIPLVCNRLVDSPGILLDRRVDGMCPAVIGDRFVVDLLIAFTDGSDIADRPSTLMNSVLLLGRRKLFVKRTIFVGRACLIRFRLYSRFVRGNVRFAFFGCNRSNRLVPFLVARRLVIRIASRLGSGERCCLFGLFARSGCRFLLGLRWSRQHRLFSGRRLAGGKFVVGKTSLVLERRQRLRMLALDFDDRRFELVHLPPKHFFRRPRLHVLELPLNGTTRFFIHFRAGFRRVCRQTINSAADHRYKICHQHFSLSPGSSRLNG